MNDNASVVVFPSVFAQTKINLLVANINKILKIKKQQFKKIRKDDTVIVIDANDPVFASSAINLLFGISKVAIAKQVKNDFDSVVKGITKIGKNLLLKGDNYLVRVEGKSFGYLPKDVEIAATSSLIEKTSNLGAKPGTEQNHNKIIYCYLTKSNAYVCIFIDKGLGGIPYNSQKQKIVCCVFDELSAVSCLETIKQGFDVKIVLAYNKKSDLLNLVKMVNKILPRTLYQKIELEFFNLQIKGTSSESFLLKIYVIIEILVDVAKFHKVDKVSLPLSPLIYPSSLIDNFIKDIVRKNLIPHIPLAGIERDTINNAKEIGLAKFLPRIEKYGKINFNKIPKSTNQVKTIAHKAIKTKKVLMVTLGPNNIHDIMDFINK